MLFRMDNYLEKWSMIYKPISHNPEKGSEGKRFYRIDDIEHLAPLIANLPSAKSPSLAYVTRFEGDLAGTGNKLMSVDYYIFILVKQQGTNIQNGVVEEVAAMDAKMEGVEIAQDLLAYMQNDYRKNNNKDIGGIDMDKVAIFNTPRQLNGWWPTAFCFSKLMSRNLCVNKEKYESVLENETDKEKEPVNQ